MEQIELLWHQSAFQSFLFCPGSKLSELSRCLIRIFKLAKSICYKCCSNLHFYQVVLVWAFDAWLCSAPCVQTYLRNIFLVLYLCIILLLLCDLESGLGVGRALSNIYICLSWLGHRTSCVSCNPVSHWYRPRRMRRREKPYLPLEGYEHFMYAWNGTSFLVSAHSAFCSDQCK